jgi:hypothetical protein
MGIAYAFFVFTVFFTIKKPGGNKEEIEIG